MPSLIAIQQDVMRYRVSLKHALASRNVGVRMAFLTAVVAIIAWFAVTMGAFIVTGTFIWDVATFIPIDPTIGTAFAMFISGAVCMILVLFVASHITHLRRQTRGA